jgi:hypothetical protein
VQSLLPRSGLFDTNQHQSFFSIAIFKRGRWLLVTNVTEQAAPGEFHRA